MKELLLEFKEYCKTPKIESGKANSYSNAILYLLAFLNENKIDKETIEKLKNVKPLLSQRNSELYNKLHSYLKIQGRTSYLTKGYVSRSLTCFFDFYKSKNL